MPQLKDMYCNNAEDCKNPQIVIVFNPIFNHTLFFKDYDL